MASIAREKRLSPQHSAWLTLGLFFTLFCAIVGTAVTIGWNFYTTTMHPIDGSVLRGHVASGIAIQGKGQLNAASLDRPPAERDPCVGESDICAYLVEGDSVRTQPGIGYGPVASLVLADKSQIDLWAHPTGAELTLERYRTTTYTQQWQDVVVHQTAGYARYDLRSESGYEQATYTVEISGGIRVALAPGGSYSINLPSPQAERPPQLTSTGTPLLVEVASRSGTATISRGTHQSTLRTGELIQVASDGTVGEAQTARWELLADRSFGQYYAQDEFKQKSQTWRKFGNGDAPDMKPSERNGRFTMVQGCRPESPDFCTAEQQTTVGQLRRDGGQTRPFTTGIEQTLDADVSELTTLRLTAWVRVLTQTVELAGVAGSECPVMIHLVYKDTSPTDQQLNRYFCVYTTGQTPQNSGQVVGEIWYRPVPPFAWYRLDIDLRDDQLLKKARYIQTIRVESRGHDYFAEITDISLMGRQ